MNKLTLILAVALISMPTHATEKVENKDGRVLYSGSCASKYVFIYQEGGQLQRPCIGSTDTVSLEEFLRKSQRTDCRSRVRVNQAVIDGDVLYASNIEEMFGCINRD